MIYKSPVLYSFGTSKKKTEEKFIQSNTALGPGEYSGMNKSKSTQKYSFGKTPRVLHTKGNNLGPGEYIEETGAFGKNVPKYSISKSHRKTYFDKHSDNDDIGPGYYDTEPTKQTNKKKTQFFSKAPKIAPIKNSNPGPGEYEQQSYFGKTDLKKEMHQRDKKESVFAKQIKENFTPGPGAYNTTSDFNPQKGKKGKGVLLRGKQKPLSKLNTPGVGEYEVGKQSLDAKKKSPSYHVGKSKRTFFGIEGKDEIGPGAYNPSKTETKRGYTFSKEPKLKRPTSSTPGAGAYKIPCGIANAPLYVKSSLDQNFKFV